MDVDGCLYRTTGESSVELDFDILCVFIIKLELWCVAIVGPFVETNRTLELDDADASLSGDITPPEALFPSPAAADSGDDKEFVELV